MQPKEELIRRHIKKAVKEKRYCYAHNRQELNTFLVKHGIAPYLLDEGEMYKKRFIAHLEEQGYKVASFPKNY